MSAYSEYMVHMYAHDTVQDGCAFCTVLPPVRVTCSPENPITAEEAAEPWSVVESVTLRRDG